MYDLILDKSFGISGALDGSETSHRYEIHRVADGELVMNVTWRRVRNTHGHRYLQAEGSAKHYGETEVRANLPQVLADDLDDALDPLPGVVEG